MWGDPLIVDETLEPIDTATIQAGDVVGIGLHTGNALRGYEVGRRASRCVGRFGGIHSLFPDEALRLAAPTRLCVGTAIPIWSRVIRIARQPTGTRLRRPCWGDQFLPARWDLPRERHVGLGANRSRLSKHCSFARWRTDGQEPRQRGVEAVIREVVELRRLGFRFIALADDNFYP
jgi:hypothetical protein